MATQPTNRPKTVQGVQGGFSGLTAGKPVYLNTTAGGVTQTPPNANKTAIVYLGKAVSSTEILIDKRQMAIGSSSEAFGGADQGSSTIHTALIESGTETFFVKTGFRPSKIDIRASLVPASGTIANYTMSTNGPVKIVSGVDPLNGSSEYQNLLSVDQVVETNDFDIDSIEDNGFFVKTQGVNLTSSSGTTVLDYIAQQ